MGANASTIVSGGAHSTGTNFIDRPFGMYSSSAVPQSYVHQYSTSMAASSSSSDQLAQLHKDKKKKIASFATLRKKLIRRKRASKSFDHARVIRDFLSDWNPREISALVDEYEASNAVKDLMIQADLARPPANNFTQDLSHLFEYKYCSDLELIFQGTCSQVHRALLAVRCPYFRKMLTKVPSYGSQLRIDIRTPGVDVPMFNSLLRYLYTGEFSQDHNRLDNLKVLMQLGEEFGTPNYLDHDIRYLLDTGEYTDCLLVFCSEQELHNAMMVGDVATSCHQVTTTCGGLSFTPARLEVPCHKAILSARSPFFRNLIQRRSRSVEEYVERALQTPTKIVLDESVIPRRYARVLLQAIYLDAVNLSCILHGSTSTSSLSEVQAIVTGHGHMTLAEEAMELYQIGRFIELDILAQGCEDIIVESLSFENLVSVLHWSDQPYGSEWVRRQALHFLREEFSVIAASPVLYELDKTHLIQILQSDFLQASELEVLQAVLKWGEHQLIKRMEEREPNILTHTAHSVTKKGIKKRDLSDVELRDILSDLLPLVRVDHVLPPNCDVLNNAIKRGLVSSPPSHMIGDDTSHATAYRVNAWIRGKNNGLFVKARYFSSYADEAKSLLNNQMVQEMEMGRLRMIRMSNIPDTLYMVDESPPPPPDSYAGGSACSLSAVGLDILASAVPVPDSKTVQLMVKREQELRKSSSAQRAYQTAMGNRRDINRQIQLRVVREFNLPDTCADVFTTSSYYRLYQDQVAQSTQQHASSANVLPQHHATVTNVPPSHQQPPSSSYTTALHNRLKPQVGVSSTVAPSIGRSYHHSSTDSNPYKPDRSTCNEGRLSDIMPDIAMATASVNRLQLSDSSSMTNNTPAPIISSGVGELDLGDGNNHSNSNSSSSSPPMFL